MVEAINNPTTPLTPHPYIVDLCVWYGTDPKVWRAMDNEALLYAWVTGLMWWGH